MRKLKLLALGLISLLAVNVSAAEVDKADKLIDCMTNATDTVCTLTADVELSASLEVGKKVTLDLNGNKITPAGTFTGDSLIIVLHGGELTIEDSKGNGEINTGDNAQVFVGIKMTKAVTPIPTNPAEAVLIINSGTIKGTSYGISGNGNPGRENTSIIINGGTVAAIKDTGTGIFQPQSGSVEINGGTITGGTGIEMRSGELVVNGGNITGTYKPVSSIANGNGTTTLGAGIAIAQHTTKKEISVSVAGGEIKGYSALYQSNPQEHDQDTLKLVEIEITGGNFEVINDGKEAVHSENYEGFISGGSFSTDIDEKDIAKDLEEVVQDGVHYVGTKNKINIVKEGEGTVTANFTEAIEGQPVKLTVTPAEGYKIKDVIITVDGKEIEYKDYTFTMPNDEVEVKVTFEKEEVKADPTKDETVSSEAEKLPENPKTNDAIALGVTVLGISLIGVVSTLYIKKKYN